MQVSDLLAQYGHGTGAHRQETGPTLSGQGMTAEQSHGRSFNAASPGSALQGTMPTGLGLQSQPNSAVHSGSGKISPRTGTSITTATGSKERLLQLSSAGFSDSPDVSTPWPSAPQPRVDRGHDDDTPPLAVSCLCLICVLWGTSSGGGDGGGGLRPCIKGLRCVDQVSCFTVCNPKPDVSLAAM
jgi:hypothetical protein